jgi:hypothetical protein
VDRFQILQKNNDTVTVGGVRALREFSREQIVIGVNGATVTISGTRLKISRFDENEIIIIGTINGIQTHSSGVRNA